MSACEAEELGLVGSRNEEPVILLTPEATELVVNGNVNFHPCEGSGGNWCLCGGEKTIA